MGKGSKSSSSSNSNTTTNTQNKNINVQGVQGTSVFTDDQVTVTDSGAIAGSLAIGQDAVAAVTAISAAFLQSQADTNNRALGLSEDIAAGAGNFAKDAAALAETAATDDTAETIQTLVKWGAGAAVAVAGVYIFTKGK